MLNIMKSCNVLVINTNKEQNHATKLDSTLESNMQAAISKMSINNTLIL